MAEAQLFGSLAPAQGESAPVASFEPWPIRMARAIAGGLTLPGDVYAGKVDPLSDEAIRRSTDLAGTMLMGATAAPAGAIGSGAVRRATTALPMDEASRIARAKEMGFAVDEPLYHGGGKSFNEFDLSKAGTASGSSSQRAAFLTPEAQVAGHYAQIASVREPLAGEAPHYSFDSMGTMYHNVYDGAQIYPSFVKPGKQKVVDIPYYNTAHVDAAIEAAKREGFDTLRIKNMADTGTVEGSRADQVAVLNPSHIRSRFAAFDPSKANSANILAGLGALGIVAPSAFGSLAPSE